MSATERHYSVVEIAELWGLSPDTVRALFRDTPGVLKIDRPKTRSKRAYLTIKVPETVMLRVHERLSKKAA